MEISDKLRCLFSVRIDERDGKYVVEVPEQEIELRDVEEGGTYRVAILPPIEESETTTPARQSESGEERGPPEPPVKEGERREVEIEDIGEQGDGIARVERGFVVIVPDTDQGERVTVEIIDVRPNVAFAEVVNRQSHI